MSINATFLGQLIAVLWVPFTLFICWTSYKLGTRKTNNPKIITVVGFFLAFMPPLALIYVAVLALKSKMSPHSV